MIPRVIILMRLKRKMWNVYMEILNVNHLPIAGTYNYQRITLLDYNHLLLV